MAEAPLERVATRSASTISARAFAPLDRLLYLSARFSTDSTRWLLPKGRNAVKELALLPAAWPRMFPVDPSRTEPASRILVGAGHIAAPQLGHRTPPFPWRPVTAGTARRRPPSLPRQRPH